MDPLPTPFHGTRRGRGIASASRWRVRTFLIWLVLACLLPGVIGAAILILYEYRQSRTQLDANVFQTARALVQTVDNHLLRAQAVAQALTTSDALLASDFARFHRQARGVLELAGIGTNVILWNKAGQQIVNTFVDYGTALPSSATQDMTGGVFKTNKPAISGVFLGPVVHDTVVTVNVPVLLDGEAVYAVSVGILSKDLNAILTTQDLPRDWIVAVFDSEGRIAGRTHSPERFVGHRAVDGIYYPMMRSPEGLVEATTIEGIRMVTYYSRSQATNWRVAIGIPPRTVFGSLERTLAILAVGVAALFAVGMVLARAMSQRIAHSVQALTAPAVAIGEGRAAPVPELHIQEAEEVATAIGRAAALLKERSDMLAARERDLIEAHRLARFGTWHFAPSTGEITTSDSVREIFGRAIPPFPAQRGSLLTVECWEKANVALQELLGTGKGFALELQGYHVSGATVWIEFKAEAILDEGGQVVGARGSVQDITERREIQEELRKFKFFSDHAADAHLLFDENGRVRYANALACQQLGYDEAELLTLHIADIDTPESRETFREIFERSKKLVVPPFERTHRRKDRSSFPVEITVTVQQFKGEWLMFTTSRDITERKLAEQRVRDAALHDSLTGLPNRALIFEYCSHLLAAAKRNHTRGALLFIDLDRFKPINDLYGHEAGDRVLEEVSRRLCLCTRHEDLVGRLSGDEFVVVLPYLDADHNRAPVVARHVIAAINRPIRIDGMELSVSPSIGISYFPEHASDTGALIHAADLAMYQAKHAGRGSYYIYTPELEARADQALALELRLKNALRNRGLTLHYQPIIDIRTGRLTGAEALLRLADRDGEAPGPATFIPVAEASGLIGEIGEWVVTEACRQHQAWLEQGMKVTMAINVSPLQFRQKKLAEKLGAVITDTGIDPACLEIEVAESALMENLDDAVEILNRIKSLGVKVALDDFGTGYSSLSRLSNLPLDKIKVDQSFVQRIEGDRASRAVTEAIIALGRTLKLDVVGEGIESEDALRYLQEHGCDQAQGFWLSHPLPPAEFAQWHHEKWPHREDPATSSA